MSRREFLRRVLVALRDLIDKMLEWLKDAQAGGGR